MADIKRGLKAGLAAGIFIGIFNAISPLIFGLDPLSFVFFFVPFGVVYGLTGLLIGAVLSLFYDKIGIKNLALKSAVVGLILTFISLAVFFLPYTSDFISNHFGIGDGGIWYPIPVIVFVLPFLVMIPLTFLSWLIFSLIFGLLWRAKKPK